jgi:hypothetical protein
MAFAAFSSFVTAGRSVGLVINGVPHRFEHHDTRVVAKMLQL